MPRKNMIKDLLQGKPLGHPLHTIIVHLPIGLFLLSFIFDVCGKFSGAQHRAETFVVPAYYTMSVGIFFALVAAIPGLADYTSIRRDHPARRTATWHMILNIGVVALYIVNLAIRNRTHDPFAGSVANGPFVLSIIAIALLAVSGYLGGKMVYGDGVGVGRHRRNKGRTPRETIVTDGTLSESDLGEGDSLRLDINGTIVAVAKVEGQIYAFQDFCTHRFGPLSEGSFDGTNVRCPWHGSCFDMRSGKVVEGPAKTDIRAFEVEMRDGQVRIRVTADV
jgi:nitrite reductase/ring-hydroxylating ferredoxin subunit/uncharacterized membrane protein